MKKQLIPIVISLLAAATFFAGCASDDELTVTPQSTDRTKSPLYAR